MSYSKTGDRPWFLRIPIAIWKVAVGVVLCQSALGAIVVVGWTSRLLQRLALRNWWKASPLREQEVSFDDFSRSLPVQCVPHRLPNWILAEKEYADSQTETKGALRRILRRLFGSLPKNISLGVTGALSIFLFTLPATSLWLYSWVLGWNISFFKLYEQSHLGISLGLFGILLFIGAMLYVPLAHARQAVTGKWQAFFDLRFNWRLARRNPTAMLPAAIAFAIASTVILFLKIVPYYVGSSPDLANLSTEQLRQWLDRYYLATGAVLFPAYVLVWMVVAKAYAKSVANEYRENPTSGSYRGVERQALAKLQLEPHTLGATNPIVRGTWWTVGRVATVGSLALSCLIWFEVAAGVFVAQFLNYLPGSAWLNHPLVLLPWIKFVPPGLMP